MRFIYLFLLTILVGCGTEATVPAVELHSDNAIGEFKGGLYKVWASLNNPQGVEDVRWRIGSARISKQTTIRDAQGNVTSDTLWLEWNQLPPMSLDSTEVVSTDTSKSAKKTYKYDTSYVDTVAYFVKGVEQGRFSVQINNILPKIDSALVGSVWQQPIHDSVIILAAHPGQLVNLTLKLSDKYKNWRPVIHFAKGSNVNQVGADSLYTFYWRAPDTLTSDTTEIEVADERSAYGRKYKLVRMSYAEFGSLWVSSADGVQKIAETGQLIFKVSENFTEVSDMVINPFRSQIFVADRGANKLVRFNLDGKKLAKDSATFKQPNALAWDLDAGSLWVSDKISDAEGRVRLFDLSGNDSTITTVFTLSKLVGPVGGLSFNQFHKDEILFVTPKDNSFQRIRKGIKDTTFKSDGLFDRPLHVSWDANGNKVWVADSARLYLLDTNGIVQAAVSGFSFVGGLSAGAGTVCLADTRAGKVYRFDSGLNQNISVNAPTVTVNNGFIAPIGVSVRLKDGTCWVADPESGTITLLDKKADVIRRLEGFNRPKVIRVNQGVE